MRRLWAGLILLLFPSAALAQVQGQVLFIGFNNHYRPDCWTPMLVQLSGQSDSSTTYQIQIVQDDLDRDRVIFTQDVNFGGTSEGKTNAAENFWVYFKPKPTDEGLPDATNLATNLNTLNDELKVFLCDKDGKQLTHLPITSTILNDDPVRGLGDTTRRQKTRSLRHRRRRSPHHPGLFPARRRNGGRRRRNRSPLGPTHQRPRLRRRRCDRLDGRRCQLPHLRHPNPRPRGHRPVDSSRRTPRRLPTRRGKQGKTLRRSSPRRRNGRRPLDNSRNRPIRSPGPPEHSGIQAIERLGRWSPAAESSPSPRPPRCQNRPVDDLERRQPKPNPLAGPPRRRTRRYVTWVAQDLGNVALTDHLRHGWRISGIASSPGTTRKTSPRITNPPPTPTTPGNPAKASTSAEPSSKAWT